jgi:tetratricopeptide (TPR) repeat protein
MTIRSNPYIAGAPLRGERGFFGRQDTLDWVGRELRNPATNALVLFGQRRIGKTTLLLQLKRTLPVADFLPVYFDLQDQAPRPLGKVLADLADQLAEQAMMDAPTVEAFDDRGRYFRREFLPKFYAALGEQRRPVFLLDEFDVLDQAAEAELSETAAAKSLFAFLRTVITEDARPAFVFVVGRRAEDLSVNFTATFKASLVREVWVLDQDSAISLVRQAEVNGSLHYTDAAVERILTLTDRHPYLTQLLCQRIWERADLDQVGHTPTIEVAEVEAAIPNVLEVGAQALIWLWNGLSPAERIYAAALAEVASEGQTIAEDHVISVLANYAARLRTREIELAPRDLIKRRVLEAAGDRTYRFAVELFRRWVRQNKPLADVKDEIDRVEPEADQMYTIGLTFVKRRQWEQAKRYFEDSLLANPRHFQARVHLGEMLLELGRIDAAIDELDKAYQLDRDEARLPLARALTEQARVSAKAGDEGAALAAADRALKISPNEQQAREIQAGIWQQRGDAALQRDDLVNAQAAYEKAGSAELVTQVKAARRAKEVADWEQRAQTSEHSGDWSTAADLYEQLIKHYPDEDRKSSWEAALAHNREESDLARLFATGLAALQSGDAQTAQRIFADVIYRRPDYKKEKSAAELLSQAISVEQASTLLRNVAVELDQQATSMPTRPAAAPASPLLSNPPVLTLELPVKPQPARSKIIPFIILALTGLGVAAFIYSSSVMTLLVILCGAVAIGAWLTRRPASPKRGVESVAFSPDGTALVSGSEDKIVRIWNVQNGTLIREFDGHEYGVMSVAFSPDGQTVASASIGSLRLWNLDGTSSEKLTRTSTCVNFSPDGKLLASGTYDKGVEIWQVADRKILKTLLGQSAWVRSVAFSSNGELLAAMADDMTISLWEVSDGTLLHTISDGAKYSRGVAFSPDGTILAAASSDGKSIGLWQVSDGSLLRTINVGRYRRNGVAFSPDERILAVGADSNVQLIQVADGNLLHKLTGPSGEVNSVAFSPDGVWLASGSADGTIQLWSNRDWMTDK